MIEKGHSIEKRKCPKRKTGTCINCQPCAITTGFSGGGSFSDGKLSINADGEIGGDLAQYIGLEKFREMLALCGPVVCWLRCGYTRLRREITALRSMPSAGPLRMPI